MIEKTTVVLQVIVALGLLNVWLLRFNKATSFRGKDAQNMKEEFDVYGLPPWAMYLVGALKILIALALLVGVAYPVLVAPAAGLLTILMLGAVLMHVKVGDPIKKSIPALSLFLIGLVTVAISVSSAA